MIQILLVLSISFLVMTPIFSKKRWQRWTTYIARAQLTFQTFTLLREYLYRQSQYSKPWDSKCLALIAQMVRTVDMNPKFWGFESLSGRDIFCLKNFDTFTKTYVRVSKTNAVARAQFYTTRASIQNLVWTIMRLSSCILYSMSLV